jgi:uncharacterized membrane protein YeaQ/YmgE (transglycosylase-associated protein family)
LIGSGCSLVLVDHAAEMLRRRIGRQSVLGLIGALLGWLIFTVVIGIGDRDVFDWSSVVNAYIGTVIVAAIATWMLRGTSCQHPSGVSPR